METKLTPIAICYEEDLSHPVLKHEKPREFLEIVIHL